MAEPNTEEVIRLVEKLGADLSLDEYVQWTRSVAEELEAVVAAAQESADLANL